jgi:hypothetical protein
VLLESDLELLTTRSDASLALELDPLDLALGPGVDALDVFLGELTEVFGLDRLARADPVDVRLEATLGLLRVARLLCQRG